LKKNAEGVFQPLTIERVKGITVAYAILRSLSCLRGVTAYAQSQGTTFILRLLEVFHPSCKSQYIISKANRKLYVDLFSLLPIFVLERNYCMKKVTYFVILILAMVFVGCGLHYNGKYINTKVPVQPIDEFKLDKFVVLGFENKDLEIRDEWLFKFYTYLDGKKYHEFVVKPEYIQTRRFYLKEKTADGLLTRAQFETTPTYLSSKDRIIAYLKSLNKQSK
jgi:hypothetical protein